MQIFTTEALLHIKTICETSSLKATWKEGTMLFAPNFDQLIELLKDGKKAVDELRGSYEHMDYLVPKGHYDHMQIIKLNFIRDEIIHELVPSDFNKEFTPFWDALAERGESNLREAVDDVSDTIIEFILAEFKDALKVDPNIDRLIANKGSHIGITIDPPLWELYRMDDVRKNLSDWLYCRTVREGMPDTLEEVHWNTFKKDHLGDLKDATFGTYIIAPSLKTFLKMYPEGLDMENLCMQVDFKGRDPLYLKLRNQVFFTDSPGVPMDTFIPNFHMMTLVEKEGKTFSPFSSYHEFVLDVDGVLRDEVGKRIEKAMALKEFKKVDDKGRTLMHYAIASKDIELVGMVYRAWKHADIEYLLYTEDLFEYTPYGLLQSQYGYGYDVFLDLVAEMFYKKDFDKLPLAGSLEDSWGLECKIRGTWGSINYFIFELGANTQGGAFSMNTEVSALRVDAPDKPRFEILKISEMDRLAPASAISQTAVKICIDGSIVPLSA